MNHIAGTHSIIMSVRLEKRGGQVTAVSTVQPGEHFRVRSSMVWNLDLRQFDTYQDFLPTIKRSTSEAGDRV